MKAIIFNCIGALGNIYKYVVICKDDEVDKAIKCEKDSCVKIDSYSIVSLYEYICTHKGSKSIKL